MKDNDLIQVWKNYSILQEFMPKIDKNTLDDIFWLRKFIIKYYKAVQKLYYSPNNPVNREEVEKEKKYLDAELRFYPDFEIRYLQDFPNNPLYIREQFIVRIYFKKIDITPVLCIY